MQNSQEMAITTLSLPKGGGAINGMGESVGQAGPDGMVTFSIPLPFSAGRGVAPALSLSYSSGAGNGPFGMGWQCSAMSISRRTQKGVPQYNEDDEFLSPSGEVMAIALNDSGFEDVRTANRLQGIPLPFSYKVTRYQPRLIQDFIKIEYWQPVKQTDGTPFWIIYSPDGQTHILGKNSHSRVANAENPSQIASWLLEETVTPTGEHIYYQYSGENQVNCTDAEIALHPQDSAQRYLARIDYGNISPQASLFVLDEELPNLTQWLFHLVFDYGERDISINKIPTFEGGATGWLARPDMFSRYDFGIEIRNRRLCHQVLGFHRLEALNDRDVTDEIPVLVNRLTLDYDLNNSVSTLVAVRQVAYETDGSPITQPPLEFDYQRFDTGSIPGWQEMPQLEAFNGYQPYQMIDLYGEGTPGILYQETPGAWWYKSPQRQIGGDSNAVTYGAMKALPKIPRLQEGATLMDINGDGRLDWVITSAGVRGFHSIHSTGEWTHFTPLNTLPTEYFHPKAQLADLVGAGLSDLVLIGPKSVRLYANQQGNWAPAQDVTQAENVSLPVIGIDSRQLVAFADMLGSGQQHLVEITADSVKCWPNMGHGRFGQPLTLEGFSQPQTSFNPDRVFLADIDGSGTNDIIYAHSECLEIYLNESGNRFSKPISLLLPDGVNFDNTCQLQAADIQGLGIASLVMTVPHMSPTHWRCDLALNKPWLLNVMNNNRGAETCLFYRSSAQFWLDEKQLVEAAGQQPECHLPFPMHLHWRSEIFDEITGNRLTQEQEYAHGSWDGQEREFRGFGRLIQRDTDGFAQGTVDIPTHPSRTVSWFATGIPEIDTTLSAEFWRGDDQAFSPFSPRFTRWENDSEAGSDVAFIPSEHDAFWLNRAMKGQLLRSELYGDDGTPEAEIPYSVTEMRHQVRALPTTDATVPSAWCSTIETRSYQYQRVAADPQCSQQVVIKADRYGSPLLSVAINYPRRKKPEKSPYPDDLPETLFDSSYDTQQQQLHLTKQQQNYFHLTNDDNWLLGLPKEQRNDGYQYDQERAPANGFTLETLIASNSLIGSNQPFTYLGQSRVAYQGGVDEQPSLQALVAYGETAILDEKTLQAFVGVLDSKTRDELLFSAGYQLAPRLFRVESEPDVWVARQGYSEFGDYSQFWRPLSQRSTLLTGKTTLKWDKHYCVVIETQDAAQLVTQARYDYRFLTPYSLTDANDNQHYVVLNPFGEVIASRFWGTEAGKDAGYSTPQAKPFVVPATIEAALALSPGIPVAHCAIFEPESWMQKLTQHDVSERMADNGTLWNALLQARFVTEDGYVCALGRRRWMARHGLSVLMLTLLAEIPRTPPHSLTITTDRYDSDDQQQLRQRILFSDGFGRLLQSAQRVEAGESWQRSEDSSLVVNVSGTPALVVTDNRWAVSGRTEYDGKGQGIRVYQPYFLDDWRYLSDDSARTDLFADTHIYDPLGREYQVITAKGYRRERQYTPWFVVNQDENDTAANLAI
ncbi:MULTISPECIES: insecticidal toxin complex toxin subunit YenB [Yersinia]|uniref:insecticidal toxin complex toxin subunit YenB n=1 Tax=Yersinia TaxID=629 RepID=UPI000EAED6FF|nr:insecticidal toxin complex toxin subunit YenB [Yersinia sp. IP36721]